MPSILKSKDWYPGIEFRQSSFRRDERTDPRDAGGGSFGEAGAGGTISQGCMLFRSVLCGVVRVRPWIYFFLRYNIPIINNGKIITNHPARNKINDEFLCA